MIAERMLSTVVSLLGGKYFKLDARDDGLYLYRAGLVITVK